MLQLKFSNMEKYRIGSDIDIYWVIRTTGSDLGPLDNYKLRLFYTCNKGRYEVTDFRHDNFTLSWKFKASEQKVLGDYTLTLEIYTKGGVYVVSQDYCGAFSLVGRSCEETSRRSLVTGGVTETLMLTSEIAVVRALPVIPEIGENGNWFIEGKDTGIRAKANSTTMGENGNWYIDGKDTGVSVGFMRKIRYKELCELRDKSELEPGLSYRIIDFVTRDQGNPTDFVAGAHLFDVIVKADSPDTLNEEARMCSTDRYIYNAVNTRNGDSYDLIGDYGVVKAPVVAGTEHDFYMYEVVATGEILYFSRLLELNQLAYTPYTLVDGVMVMDENISLGVREIYRTGDNLGHLEAWKIWYSLDNDVDRFSWANEENGRGVIYRMIDSNNNDCPYDFVSIRFWDEAQQKYTYTFDDGLGYNASLEQSCHHNTIGRYVKEGDRMELGYHSLGKGSNNILGPNCKKITIEGSNNVIGPGCENITAAYGFDNNVIGPKCISTRFGSDCKNNVLGAEVSMSIISGDCSFNNVGAHAFIYLGEGVTHSEIGGNCNDVRLYGGNKNVKVGDNCVTVEVGADSYGITIGSGSSNILMGENCRHINIGNNCTYVQLKDGRNPAAHLELINVGDSVNYVELNRDGDTGAFMGRLTVDSGIHGTNEENPFYITGWVIWDSATDVVPVMRRISYNTYGQIVKYCLADLIKPEV